MILAAEIECLIYDAQSLKEKRSVLKRVMARIRNQFNVSISPSKITIPSRIKRTELSRVIFPSVT